MKKLLVGLLSIGLITACSGGDSSTDTTLSTQSFQTFSLGVPSSWRIIDSENFANTIPEGTVALFLASADEQGFIQNVNVVKESINTDASSIEYGKANILLGSKALLDYRAVSTEEQTIQGVQTVSHQFRARNTTTEPLRSYYQAYFVKNRIGYTLTCVTDGESTDQASICNSVLQSFRLL